jgi:hypothetical protein
MPTFWPGHDEFMAVMGWISTHGAPKSDDWLNFFWDEFFIRWMDRLMQFWLDTPKSVDLVLTSGYTD